MNIWCLRNRIGQPMPLARFLGIVLAVAGAGLSSACSLPPGLELRDDYMGRDLFEPEIAVKPVPRDFMGNPVLSQPEPSAEEDAP